MIYQLGMQINYSYKLLFSFWVIFPITIVNELQNQFCAYVLKIKLLSLVGKVGGVWGVHTPLKT